VWDFLIMFINLNVIVTCFGVMEIPAMPQPSEVVETEPGGAPSRDWEAIGARNRVFLGNTSL
jgi:hypothetical protein